MATGRKLGKDPARVDLRTLKFRKYIPLLPPPPSNADWGSGITDWGELGNDIVGDCVFAGGGHALQTWSAATGPIFNPTTDQILAYYSLWAGYNPADPSTDQGYVELDFLNHWRKEKFIEMELVGYADPDVNSLTELKQAIALFGGVYIGIQLPYGWQSMKVWEVTGPPVPWNGHAVWVNKYDDGLKLFNCVTWGENMDTTYDFLSPNAGGYLDEAHCLLSQIWLDRAPADFKTGDLMADLKQFAQAVT
jgi:hypothetical protein